MQFNGPLDWQDIMDAQAKFTAAISSGALSDDPTADNFAGHYMYMHTEQCKDSGFPVDLFKHIDTRKYLPVYRTGYLTIT